jgi:hypothetical protein
MSCFLYFIPKLKSMEPDTLSKMGLSDRIDKAQSSAVIANGPDGGPGMVICDRSCEMPPRIVLDRQTWRPAPKRGADVAPFWIGYWNDKPPTEESLRRPKMLPGEQIELRDSSKWTVPKLVQFDDVSDSTLIQYKVKLPQVLDVDDDGEIVSGKIDPAYQTLWNEGWLAHESLTQQASETGSAVMTIAQSRQFACRLMAVNYRVSAIELTMLSLLDDSSPMQIVLSAIDNAAFWQAIKNRVGRLEQTTTDLPSGAERPQTESTTSTPIDPALAS